VGGRELRGIFDEAAELYDRMRPGYPAKLFEDLAEATGLGPGARVLEIGCGTGQATVALAERGYEIVAVELGASLAEVARRNLARFGSVDVVNAAFEAWPLPAEPFDVVFCATAFRFGPANFRRYEWEVSYSTAEYLDLLMTYSGHRAMRPAARRGLLDCIARLIDDHHGGRIAKRYLTELRWAHRRRRPA
jgi:SAM-dependent methyltransferase